MSEVAACPPVVRELNPRRLAQAAALALGFSVGTLAWRLAATPAPTLALGALAGGAAFVLAALAEPARAALLAKAFAGAAAFLALAAVAGDPARLAIPSGLASLALLAGGAWRLRGRPRLDRATLALTAALLAALAAFNVYYVTASQDLEIADFMFYRLVSIAVATLVRSGKILSLAIDLAGSMPRDYFWAPALAPGLALAAFGPLSRAVYQSAILVAYAAPALLALAWAARRIAGARDGAAFALAAVVAAYPFGVVVAARGMPDIGGLALVVLALRLAERLARALDLTRPRPAIAMRLGFALALTLFAMFLFRRWYAFAGLAIAAALAAEVVAIAARRRAAFRWREAALAAATGALTLLALLAPVLIAWLPDPAAHDYSAMYAAYRKTPAALAAMIGADCGFAPLALAALGAVWLLARRASRFTRLALVSGLLGAALFLRVQSPYPHHLYLIAPFLALFVAAPLLRLYARARLAGLAALAALAGLTMTSLGAFAPQGWLPTAARPPAPRADLSELRRLKDWVDARATPTYKVCGIGSSYTFSGQLLDELWQLKAERSPLASAAERTSVAMTDVDAVDGPPNPDIKDCAVMIVGDPVQTHVIPAYQLTVTLPAQEMLDGVGLGAHYRRTGESFALEHGVKAIVFERTSRPSDADMAALSTRWRAARLTAPR